MPENNGIDATERARRAALVCCYFARNFAYYSVFRSSRLLNEEGFWLTVHGNFLDVSVLEWCKLFGNWSEKFHWKNVVPDPDVFRKELLVLHGMDDAALKNLWDRIKEYRDEYVAHLEWRETTTIPNINVAYLLVAFYFSKLKLGFPVLEAESSLPTHFDRYYDQCLKQAREVLVQLGDVSAFQGTKTYAREQQRWQALLTKRLCSSLH